MKVHGSWLAGCERRFVDVFTKLRALQQVDFSKIVLLDLDVIVVRDIGELFSFETPAALFRGSYPSAAGAKRAGETYFSKATGDLQGGVNAGVMVLQPDLERC